MSPHPTDPESVQIVYRPVGIGGGGLGGGTGGVGKGGGGKGGGKGGAGKGGGKGGGEGSASDEVEEHTVELWSSHFVDLREMYISGGHDESLMLTRLFAMAYRYEMRSRCDLDGRECQSGGHLSAC